jgi:hypothetical protein
MKPQYAPLIRLSRCSCCVSRYSKHRSKGSKHGNSAARSQSKRDIRKAIDL